MARGQVTVEDMTTSLMGVGSLSSLADRPKRDSPLAVGRSQTSVGPDLAQAGTTSIVTKEPKKGSPSVTAKLAPSTSASSNEAPQSDIEAQLTDVVMVPMTARMRTRVLELAAELQRRRLDKSHRITANVVFRVAIESFLERFDANDLGGVNSEPELLQRVARKTKASSKGLG